jgi:hypothetical protein
MFSVSGMIDIGINMDRDLIGDTSLLVEYMRRSFEELKGATPPEKQKAKKRPPMGTTVASSH